MKLIFCFMQRMLNRAESVRVVKLMYLYKDAHVYILNARTILGQGSYSIHSLPECNGNTHSELFGTAATIVGYHNKDIGIIRKFECRPISVLFLFLFIRNTHLYYRHFWLS